MCKSILKGQNIPGTDGTYHGTDGTCPRDRRDAHQGVSRQNSLCLLVFFFPHYTHSGLARLGFLSELNLARPLCRNVLETFVVCVLEDFAADFPGGGFFWALFPYNNEENRTGDKIRKKIRRPKNKNPRKIRSAKNRP